MLAEGVNIFTPKGTAGADPRAAAVLARAGSGAVGPPPPSPARSLTSVSPRHQAVAAAVAGRPAWLARSWRAAASTGP